MTERDGEGRATRGKQGSESYGARQAAAWHGRIKEERASREYFEKGKWGNTMKNYTNRQFGHYRLTRLLGEGGFAQVYLGEHIHLGTQAAVKILTTQLSTEEIAQFRQEARVMMELEHPHIARVLDFGLEGSIPFLVMAYAKGGTLRTKHPRGSRLPLAQVVSYIQQLAAALQEAHNAHLIHRDVKPENMLVRSDGTVLLSDFGIALLVQQSRHLSTQDVVGTATYMAPEQFAGKPRRASDQYALAIVAYEWLTGAPPFRGTFVEIASQHVSAPPPPFGKQLGVPNEVERMIGKALANHPEDRFATVQEFAVALEQASQSTVTGKQARFSDRPVVKAPMPDLLTTVAANEALETGRLAIMPASPSASAELASTRVASGKRRSTFFRRIPSPATRSSASLRKLASRPAGKGKSARGWVRAMTALVVVGTALFFCARMLVSAEASLAAHVAQAQSSLSRTTWGSGVAQESPSALSIQTATDFLSAVARQDYQSAYNDLNGSLTLDMAPTDFALQAQNDDRCYGTLLRYTQVGERATGEMGEMEVLTYSLVRKLTTP